MIFHRHSNCNSGWLFLILSLLWRSEVTYWIGKFGNNSQASQLNSALLLPLGVEPGHWDLYCFSVPPCIWSCWDSHTPSVHHSSPMGPSRGRWVSLTPGTVSRPMSVPSWITSSILALIGHLFRMQAGKRWLFYELHCPPPGTPRKGNHEVE